MVGMGAVGSLFVYFLNNAGVKPYVLRRHCEEFYFCTAGCRRLEFTPVSEIPQVDYTIVAVKAPQSLSAVPHLRGVAVVAQNGVGGFELIREMYPNAVAAVVTYGVYREGCRSELRGVGEIILPKEVRQFGELIQRGGASVRLVNDIEPYRWLKLAINAAVNPITAILQRENKVILENNDVAELAVAVVTEVAEVARALGVALENPVGALFEVVKATGGNLSSMASDVKRCVKTEIDFINGAVVKYGRALGIPTPYNKTLYSLVKALEEKC